MDVTFVECSYDVEEFACLDAHRTGLFDLCLGVAADRYVEVGTDDADRVFAQRFDQDVRKHGYGALAFNNALNIAKFFLENALFDGEFHFLILLNYCPRKNANLSSYYN